MKNALSWRRKIMIIILIVLLIGIYILFSANGVSGIKDAVTNYSILINVSCAMQILTSIAIVIGGIIGVWQYTLTSKAERSKMNIERIQKAIDLSRYYKNSIIKKYRIIQYVFNNSGLMDILNRIDTTKIQEFDLAELGQLMPDEDRKVIEAIRTSPRFIQAVVDADFIFDLGLDVDKIKTVNADSKEKKEKLTSSQTAILQKFMANILTDTLNNLEYFAMHFSHHTADETVVYQSLHQTYLTIIQVLYYNIAIGNKLDQSKYFTNVIKLYQLWYNRDSDLRKKRINAARKFELHGSNVEEIDS